MSKIAMVPCWSLRPSTSCFPGYAIFSPTVSTTAPSCVRHSPNSASGPSRSSNAPLTRSAFNCCRAVGSSNEPWLGSIETAAWQRISKRRSRAAKRGFTSPRYSSLSGDWLDQYTTIYDTLQPYRLRFRHLGGEQRRMALLAAGLEDGRRRWALSKAAGPRRRRQQRRDEDKACHQGAAQADQ